MYKVFVENRPIIICKKNTIPIDCEILFADRVKSLEKDVFTRFNKKKTKMPIIILSQNPTKDFNRLFEKHTLIIAAGGLVRKKNKLLFIKRLGKWDIPKGKLEKLEEPQQGAIREVQEECGIKELIIEQLIIITYHTYTEKNKALLKKTYWYAMKYEGNNEIVVQTEEGITKAKWCSVNKLDKIKNNTYESILEVINSYFENKETENKIENYE